MSDANQNPEHRQSYSDNIRFGEEITMAQYGFSFQPIIGLELEIDDRVYMYSDDGDLEIILLGGSLENNASIAEINDLLAAEALGNVNRFELIAAGTDVIQGVRGFLNEVNYVDAGEEAVGRSLICSPRLNQYFFFLITASIDYWKNQGRTIFDQLKSRIQFHPQFLADEIRQEMPAFSDLTLDIFETVDSGEDFLFTIQKGDISFLLAARSNTQEDTVTVTQIIAPNGTQNYRFDPASGEFSSTLFENPLVGRHGEVCIFLPRDNQNPLVPGTYTFSFATESGAGLQEVQVILRSGRVIEIQTLDFNFWLAVEDERFYDQDNLDQLENEIYVALEEKMLPFNLRPGKIDFIHPAMDELEAFSSINVRTDLADCSYMISENINNTRALSAGLVNQIYDGDPDAEVEIAAVSSGSPGMIMASTSPHSCIILEWPNFQNEISKFADAIIEQLIIFSGIDTRAAKSQGFDGLRLNHEIAWRIRRHPLFYEAD